MPTRDLGSKYLLGLLKHGSVKVKEKVDIFLHFKVKHMHA